MHPFILTYSNVPHAIKPYLKIAHSLLYFNYDIDLSTLLLKIQAIWESVDKKVNAEKERNLTIFNNRDGS